MDTKYRLTVEELQLFANQLDTLPAKVSGHEAVTELISQVECFQKEAQKLLDSVKSDANELGKCIEVGVQLDVELPELNLLRSKHRQTEWLKEVNEILLDSANASFDQLKEAMESGTDLPPHPAVEKALGQISGLLTQVKEHLFVFMYFRKNNLNHKFRPILGKKRRDYAWQQNLDGQYQTSRNLFKKAKRSQADFLTFCS